MDKIVSAKLGDLVNVFIGGDAPKEYTKEKTSEKTVPIYSNGVEQEGLYGYTDSSKVEGDSVTISARGNVGAAFYRDQPFVPIVRLLALVPNRSLISAKYLFYLLKLDAIISTGAAQQQITAPQIKKHRITYFSNITYQNSIASILSAYDNLIENNNRRIRLLEQMAKNLYKEWFVRFRFPGHEKVEMENGLPKGWKISRVFDYGRIETGKTPPMNKREYYGGDFLFIKTPDMHGNMFVKETEETLSERGSQSQHKKLLPIGSIMVSCIGSGGVVAINAKQGHTNQQINSIILSDIENLEWLYFTCKSLKPMIELFGATGATMTNLSKGKFEKLKIIEPPKSLREAYHIQTKSIFSAILRLDEQNQLLTRQRDLLLPRLMSGKLEVNA